MLANIVDGLEIELERKIIPSLKGFSSSKSGLIAPSPRIDFEKSSLVVVSGFGFFR
jgi:hypothetical protein